MREPRSPRAWTCKLLGRVHTWCAVVIVAVVSTSTGSGAVAQEAPRFPEPVLNYQMTVNGRDGRPLFDLRGATLSPNDLEPPFESKATLRISPKLCEGRYRLGFVFQTVQSTLLEVVYSVGVRRGRIDGRTRLCPFAGLPRRGLRSLDTRITIDGMLLVRFTAKPMTRASPFTRLRVPALQLNRFAVPSGLARVRVDARYSSGRSRTVTFVADADVAV